MILLDGPHVTGLEAVALVNVRVEHPHHRGMRGPCRHRSRSEQLWRDEGHLGGDDDDSRRGEPPAPRDQRPDGHDPGRQVDDQGEGVKHDQRLDRVPRHQPQERDQSEHGDDQPADDEKAGPHDSRYAVARRVGLSRLDGVSYVRHDRQTYLGKCVILDGEAQRQARIRPARLTIASAARAPA